MDIATQQYNLGKTKSFFIEEIHSEEWASGIRLCIGTLIVLLSIFLFGLGIIEKKAFIIQIISSLLLILYNLLFLQTGRKLITGVYIYIFSLIDIIVIPLILYSFIISSVSVFALYSTGIAAYIVSICLTSLFYKVRLSIFTGFVSAASYILFIYLTHKTSGVSDNNLSYFLPFGLITIALISIISSLASKKNYNAVMMLSNSEDKYSYLVHRLPLLLFTLDETGAFKWANRTSNQLLGIPPKAIINKNIYDFLTDEHQFLLDKNGAQGTYKINDFNDNVKFVDCVIQPAKDDKKDIFWEGMMSDVTDRELALSQREEMGNRLFQYQKMDSLSTLASGMAHDFNNILQTMNDITKKVIAESEETETKNKMETMSLTLEDARFLVSELLAVGRKQPLDSHPINLCTFMEKNIPLFRAQIGESYSIELKTSSEPVWIEGDKNYLKRILQNLVGNSRDAMPGGGSILIQCYSDTNKSSTDMGVISFKDTGTGIPRELTEKIFDPFFTTKKPGRGTGLGLALAKRIMSLHNGDISIEKTGCGGTTFRLEIPLNKNETDQLDTKTIKAHHVSTTLLLIDDDVKIRDIMKYFLVECNYTICEATSGKEAEYELRKHINDCSVVLMDWKIRGEIPEKLIDKLRKIKPGIQIIVVSGYPGDSEIINRKNIFKWITKPYDKNRIDIEIQRALVKLNK